MKITLQTQEKIKISGIQGPVEDSLFKQHLANYNNPHNITKTQIGLNNLTNDEQVKRSEMGAVGGVATLGQDGKIKNEQIPAIAVTDTFVVNGEAEMLALNCGRGDVAVRNDISRSFILKGDAPSLLSNWQELKTPSDIVQSVNGKTGAVLLGIEDIGAAPKGYFGELYEYNESGSVINAITAGEFYKLTTAVIGLTSGGNYLTASNNNLVIGSLGAGKYAVDFDCAFSAKTGTINKIAVFKNNIKQDNLTSLRKTPQGGEIYPASMSVTAGILAQGSINSLQNADGIYIQIQESNISPKGIDIELTFEGITDFGKVRFLGRHDGAASCLMKFQLWDYVNGFWENMTTSSKDLFDATTVSDYLRDFNEANTANHISNGQVKLRIHHAGTIYSIGHNLYIDKIALIKRDSDLLASGSGILSLAAGDVLDIRAASDAGNTEIKIYSMNLRAKRISV